MNNNNKPSQTSPKVSVQEKPINLTKHLVAEEVNRQEIAPLMPKNITKKEHDELDNPSFILGYN